MAAVLVYLATVIYFSYTLYSYLTFKEPTKVSNCFDEGAEYYMSLINSEEYEYH